MQIDDKNMSDQTQLAIKYSSKTIIGTHKKHNQDAYSEFLIPGGYGFAVADGINGKEGGGAIASKMAIESIKKQFKNNQFKNPQKALSNALTLANFQLFDHIQKNDRFEGMGASCAVVLVLDNLLYYAYIGNIRVYILRDNTIYRLTKDHTETQNKIDQVDNKTLTANVEETYKVTRALGFGKDVNFSVCKQPIAAEENDLLLLTSDGLFRELSEEQIAEIMNDMDASVDFITNNLTLKADETGGNDNITVSLVHFYNPDKVPYKPIEQKSKKTSKLKISKPVLIIGGIVALVLILFTINKLVFKDEKITESPKIENTKTIVKKYTKKKENIKSKAEIKPEEVRITPKYYSYTIGKSDNFYRIGIRFNVTIQQLEKDNNIHSERLKVGQKIRISVKDIHTVKKGESLSVIAEKYSTPSKHILKANNLSNANHLKEGMKLIIPFQYDDKIK